MLKTTLLPVSRVADGSFPLSEELTPKRALADQRSTQPRVAQACFSGPSAAVAAQRAQDSAHGKNCWTQFPSCKGDQGSKANTYKMLWGLTLVELRSIATVGHQRRQGAIWVRELHSDASNCIPPPSWPSEIAYPARPNSLTCPPRERRVSPPCEFPAPDGKKMTSARWTCL